MDSLEEMESLATEERLHFTYKSELDRDNLCQGDLLKKTDAIMNILKDVHPYFCGDQYKYFMVLTQSCDLVVRNGKCKSPYITLAAVRTFDDFFENKLISEKLAVKQNGYLIMNKKHQNSAYMLLERIYNNTEPDYFFLYKQETRGLTESMVASLKVSIALKSELHYKQCLEAKMLELSDEFKAKLGWLVGNIYSRVGTTDWESIMPQAAKREMLNDELKNRCIIASNESIKAIKNKMSQSNQAFNSRDELLKFIEQYPIKTKYDEAMENIENAINRFSRVPDDIRGKMINSIKSLDSLKVLLRDNK